MASFQEKVNELQVEVEELDKRLVSCSKYANYIFIGGMLTPFTIAFGLYMTNPKFIKTDGDMDRKKIIKWTVMITFVIWLALYFLNIYLKKRYS